MLSYFCNSQKQNYLFVSIYPSIMLPIFSHIYPYVAYVPVFTNI